MEENMIKNTLKKFFTKEAPKPSTHKQFAYLKDKIATKEKISPLAISNSYALGVRIAASLKGDFNA